MLTALNVALIGKAILWWRSQKNIMVTWKQTRIALLEAYGDRYKRKSCINQLQRMTQGSKKITDYFIEVEQLNLFAQLDPETLPSFLEQGLNDRLQEALIQHRPEPTTYAEWKKLTQDIGRALEAHNERKKGIGIGKAPQTDNRRWRIQPYSTDRSDSYVSEEEVNKRKKRGTCIKCGKMGHLARECRVGWKIEEHESMIKVIEGRKRSREDNDSQPQQQKRRKTQGGEIRTITSSQLEEEMVINSENNSDSEND